MYTLSSTGVIWLLWLLWCCKVREQLMGLVKCLLLDVWCPSLEDASVLPTVRDLGFVYVVYSRRQAACQVLFAGLDIIWDLYLTR